MLKYLENLVRRVLIQSGVAGRDDVERLRVQLEMRAQLAVAEAQAFAEQRLALARAEAERHEVRPEAWADANFARLRHEMESRLDAGLAHLESQLAALREQATEARWTRSDTAMHGGFEDRRPAFHGNVLALAGAGRALALALGDWTPPLHFALPAGGAEVTPLAEALSALGHEVTTSRETRELPAVFSPFLHAQVGRGAQVRDLLIGFDWGDTGFPLEAVDWLNANIAAVACVTAHAEKVLRDHGCTVPLATVGAGIDEWEHLAQDRAYKAPGKAFRFLNVSACGADQALGTLLDAFGQVFARDDDVSLIIRPTDGKAKPLLADLAERRRSNPAYPDVVVIEGALSDDRLKALYGQCHVFVSAGRAERFSHPIAHALLSGLPVVATAWGGHLDYCSAQNAWLVDYDYVRAPSPVGVLASAWAEPMPKALEEGLWFAYRADPAERFAKGWNGRKILLERHGWRDVALRLAKLAASASAPASVARKGTVGFVTSWNSKCGIAGYMGHMLEEVEPTDYVIFADKWSTLLESDPNNCLRSWIQGPFISNGFTEILSNLRRCFVRSIVIQFNFGFYNPADFRQFVDGVLAEGVAVIVELHSTMDPPQDILPIKLANFTDALRKCQRVLVHSPADMCRLKALGISANVTLFPLGSVVARAAGDRASARNISEIASFGFALPNKGLPELVEAVGLLANDGLAVRLKMWNSEYPAPASIAELDKLRTIIERLGLTGFVELHSEYLDEADCIRVLSEADLIVNPYQETNESSSAAVRFALASRAPVMVTPLPIFSELGDAVFRSKGTDARALADGIAEALGDLKKGTPQSRIVRAASTCWREQHSAHALGGRMMRLSRTVGQAAAS